MNLVRAGHLILLCACLMSAAVAVAPCRAVTTSYWEVENEEQFSAGTFQGVSISSDGKVTLSPRMELLADSGEPFVWCLAEDSKGNVYAGTGNDGKIFRITPDDEVTLWYDSEELEILALTMGAGDRLYAGTSPGGQVLRISPKGETEVFFSTQEDHIWSLAFDDQGGLYCGTGAEGKIYRAASDGRGSLFYDTKEANITVLAWREGYLYAGGSGNGLIYKIDRQGQGIMLFDADEEEICALAFGPQGQLYAAATSGEKPNRRPPRPEQAPSPEQGAEETPETVGVFVVERATPPMVGPSAVYEIDGLGSGQLLWTAPQMAMILAMILTPEGDLVVGTGDEGRLYAITSDGSWRMLADGEESQALALLDVGRDGLLVGMGNPGRVHRLGRDHGQEGTLESEAHDAAIVSRWGRISWDGEQMAGTRITLQTRSGNSEVPDETWSSWSSPYHDAEGEPVASPPARFIQWRASLSTSNEDVTPRLDRVRLAYLQRNLAPKIQGLYVYPPVGEGGVGQGLAAGEGGTPASAEGAQPSPSDLFRSQDQIPTGMRKVGWSAYDPNGDQLLFDISFRGEGEGNWKLLKEKLRNNSYTWDSRSLPDGTYRLRLEASDRPSNPEEQALSCAKDSDPFVVDNTPPRVQVRGQSQGSGQYLLTGKATDELSFIAQLWYSVDAGDWQVLSTADEVFDALEEGFSFSTEPLSPGEHTIVVKAMDMAGNTSAGKTVVK